MATHILVLTADLTMAAHVAGAASRAGTAVEVAMSIPVLLDKLLRTPADMIVLDLEIPTLDIETILPQLRQSASLGSRIVAFGPHVHEGRLQAARDAGCDVVLSRGQFHATAETLFR